MDRITIAKQLNWSGSTLGSCSTSIPIGLVVSPPVWLRASLARVCTEISLRPDYRVGARPVFQAGSATFGSKRCLGERITPKAFWLRNAPSTEHSSWFGSPTGRHRGLDRAISCSEAWPHGRPLHSWVAEDPYATDRVGTLATPNGVMAAVLAEIEKGGMA